MPLIIYNGSLIVENRTGKTICSNSFDQQEIKTLIHSFKDHDVYPIVYSYIEGKEKFSFIKEKNTKGMQEFIDTRKNDPRMKEAETIQELISGDCFYVTCIDEKKKLEPLYQKYKNQFHCIFHEDIYLHSQWLEVMPKHVSKASAIRQLQKLYECEKLIVFGDGKNDMEMFEIADEAYAVENADEDLKKFATEVIGSNHNDGVANWLMDHAQIING